MVLAYNFRNLLSKIEDHVFTENEIKKYIYDLINYLELNDYFRGVLFNCVKLNGLASYSFKTKKIKISPELIEKEAVLEYENAKFSKKLIAFINLELLQAIYHEIVHVIHNYMAFDSNLPIGYLFYVDIVTLNNSNISDDEYDRIHDLMVIERDANITSIENILLIIKKYLKSAKLYAYYEEKLKTFMLDGYVEDKEIISPIEYLYNNIYHLELPNVGNIDFYERMKLGLPLKKKDIKIFMSNSVHMISKKISCKNI